MALLQVLPHAFEMLILTLGIIGMVGYRLFDTLLLWWNLPITSEITQRTRYVVATSTILCSCTGSSIMFYMYTPFQVVHYVLICWSIFAPAAIIVDGVIIFYLISPIFAIVSIMHYYHRPAYNAYATLYFGADGRPHKGYVRMKDYLNGRMDMVYVTAV